LRDAVNGRNGAVAGLAGVLDALTAHRVHVLLVSDGYEAPGWHCGGCGRLAAVGRACPACKTTMDPVDDVVEAAVDRAMAQRIRLDVVVGNADLDVLGRIGALLRY
jgi:peptide subunit release factor 1 (eRF1)